MKTALSFALLVAAAACAAPSAPAAPADLATGRVFELRTYIANPGKLDALHSRFRDHTNRLFKKHGMEIIGFWTPIDEEGAKDTLVYLLAFPSVEAQKKAWQAFRDDPQWKAAKAASEAAGMLVKEVQSKTLRATDYSPMR